MDSRRRRDRGEVEVDVKDVPGRGLTGKCLCGVVQYCVLDEFGYALNCHCSAHIFVGSKAAWYTIADDLPQHEELG